MVANQHKVKVTTANTGIKNESLLAQTQALASLPNLSGHESLYTQLNDLAEADITPRTIAAAALNTNVPSGLTQYQNHKQNQNPSLAILQRALRQQAKAQADGSNTK